MRAHTNGRTHLSRPCTLFGVKRIHTPVGRHDACTAQGKLEAVGGIFPQLQPAWWVPSLPLAKSRGADEASRGTARARTGAHGLPSSARLVGGSARAAMIASALHSRRPTGVAISLVCLGVVASVALLSLPTASPRLPTPSELVRQSSAARSAVAHDLERGRAVPEVKADAIMEQDGDRPGGGFLSSMLRRMEGLVPSTGAQQQLARKWWECGGHACEHAQAPALPAAGIHMGALDRFRKKNCGTAECIYANAATGFNVPGTGVAGHRWASSGHLAPGAAKENVGDSLTQFGGRGAPFPARDKNNRDPVVVQERKLGTHDLHGGAKIDLSRGGPPRTEKAPLHYAFIGGSLGKGANGAINPHDQVVVRHSSVGFPRFDADGEPLPQAPPPPPVIGHLNERSSADERLAAFLDEVPVSL